MGFLVTTEADNGGKCPDWFTKTDSKSLATLLFVFFLSDPPLNPLAVMAEQFDLDLTPLMKHAGQEFGLEEYLAHAPTREEAERQFNRSNESNRAAWQDTDTLIECLESLSEVLDRDPGVFSTLKISLDWQNSYVYNGYFHQDIKDLLHIIKWHKGNWARLVRIVIV